MKAPGHGEAGLEQNPGRARSTVAVVVGLVFAGLALLGLILPKPGPGPPQVSRVSITLDPGKTVSTPPYEYSGACPVGLRVTVVILVKGSPSDVYYTLNGDGIDKPVHKPLDKGTDQVTDSDPQNLADIPAPAQGQVGPISVTVHNPSHGKTTWVMTPSVRCKPVGESGTQPTPASPGASVNADNSTVRTGPSFAATSVKQLPSRTPVTVACGTRAPDPTPIRQAS